MKRFRLGALSALLMLCCASAAVAQGTTTINGLPAAAPLDGTENVPIMQGGTTVRATTQAIANLGGGGGGAVSSVFGRTGTVTAQIGDYAVGQITGAAALASPTFTGTVTIANGSALGTPASVTLTNASGLPISTGLSGLATGMATFLATPTSANLAATVTNETGSGNLVFATSPTFATGVTLGFITGSTQCLQVSSAGAISGTGAACGSGSGAVNSVTNSDGTLTISPTTGSVVASLALGHVNTWTAAQTFNNSDIKLLGSSTGATTLSSANASATSYTATLPAATDTIAELTQTQTLTNKTISGASNTITNVPISSGVSGLGTGVATLLSGISSGSGGPVGSTSPSIASLTVTGSLTATGLVTNADLANSSVSIAGNSVSLGSTLSASTLTASLGNATTSAFGTVKPDGTTITISGGVISAVGGGGGAVSSVSNSDGSLTISPTTGAVVASINTANSLSWSAAQTFAGTGSASTPAVNFTGTVFSGGTGTTTEPLIYFSPSGATAVTTWNTAGTYLGFNSASGFTGNFIDTRVNGGSSSNNNFSVGYNGAVGGNGFNLTGQNWPSTGLGASGSCPILLTGATARLQVCSNSITVQPSAAASNASLIITTAPYTAGTTTTNFPVELLQAGSGTTAVTTWSSSGTYLGVNAVPSFAGNLMDFHVNGGASVASLSSAGAFNAASYSSGGTAGVSCSGTPTSSFAVTNGIVTHC